MTADTRHLAEILWKFCENGRKLDNLLFAAEKYHIVKCRSSSFYLTQQPAVFGATHFLEKKQQNFDEHFRRGYSM